MTNDDNNVLRKAHDALAGAHMGVPVETIMARGHARRRRQRAALAVSGSAAAGAVAVAAVLSAGGAAPAHTGGSIRTMAFTLTRNTNGTDTLKLNQGQVFDPSALQSALAGAGIPAIVHIGEFCSSDPAPPPTQGAVTVELPDGTPVGKSTPGRQSPVPGDAVTVINPAAIPTGTELSFSYFKGGHALTGGLVYQNSYTCDSQPPAPVGGTGTGPAGNS